MAKSSHSNQQQNTVQHLNNDYVRSSEELHLQKQQRHRQKIFLRRRYAAYFIGAAIIMFILFDYLGTKREQLAVQKAALLEAQQQFELANEQQEMLELQISKLEDDEYIAKLARKEYFLSEEGEIIFTIPEKDKSKENKEDNE